MSQGTGLEALSRAYEATGNPYYLNIANQALPVFTVAPPTGVRVATPLGARYLQYSFSRGTSILNAFLQSLIGLYDYTQVSGNAEAAQLRFRLSKISHVGIVVTQGTTTKFQTSATLGYGTDHFTIPALKHPGSYSVRLAATDLAGNFARITGNLQISR